MTDVQTLRRRRRARAKLKGAMLDHPGFAVERMPGLAGALDQFRRRGAEQPRAARLSRPTASRRDRTGAQPTTLFQAIGDCAGLTAAIYASAEPEARMLDRARRADRRSDRGLRSSAKASRPSWTTTSPRRRRRALARPSRRRWSRKSPARSAARSRRVSRRWRRFRSSSSGLSTLTTSMRLGGATCRPPRRDFPCP